MAAVSLCCLTLVLVSCRLAAASRLSSMVHLDSAIRDTQWVGPSDEVVFTLTEGGHVWLSRDGGLEWKDMSEAGKLPGGLDVPAAHGAYEPPKGVQQLLFHPLAPRKIFFRGGSDYHWISTDMGETYEKIKGPAGHLGVATIRMHPTESDWVLVMARRWACLAKEAAERAACADDLFLTQDFGKTWRNLTEESEGRILGFVDFDWGWSKNPEFPKHPSSYTKDTILAAVFENRDDVREHLQRNGVGLVAGWDQYVDFVRTSDYFHSAHTKTISCGNQFEIMADKLFLAVADHCGADRAQSGVKLKLSGDYGATFTDACFPEVFTERGYSVVYANDHTAFINVDYTQNSQRLSSYGDLLASDESFSLFSVSMRSNARSVMGVVDFAAVQGIPGVYIANQVEQLPAEAEIPKPGSEEEESSRDYAKSTTLISYNGGAAWQPIAAPEYDANRRPIDCSLRYGCSLHLHGGTSWIGGGGFAFVYSHASTPGLVISTGNVGSYLYQDSTVNTYLSRDAGRTWEEIAKGSHIYEFGDSGGVMVMTKHGLHTSTSSVLYSLDEGLTWEEEQFADPDQAVDIYNIRVEPDNQGKKFVIQGLGSDDGTGKPRKGILITLNFPELAKYKECGPTDYELWEPSAYGCLLGANMSLQRQTRSSTCWNGDRYKRPEPRVTPCKCSIKDFQCDFGLETVHTDPLVCQPVIDFSPSQCGDSTLSKAKFEPSPNKLRKVAGDRCTGELTDEEIRGGGREGRGGGVGEGGGRGGGGDGSSSSSQGGGMNPLVRGGGVAHPGAAGGADVHIYPGVKPEVRAHYNNPEHTPSAYSHSAHSSSGGGGGGGGHSFLSILFWVLLGLALVGATFAFLAYRGWLPDQVLRLFPFLENMRYHNMRSGFQSLAQDFGLGGDDEYEEMYRRP